MLYTLNNNMRQSVLEKKQVFLLFIALFVVLIPLKSTAEVGNKKLTLDPKLPTPGETVRAELIAHSLDFDTALVTWRVNGEVIEHGYSLPTIDFVAGPVGTTYTISATAEDASGERVFLERGFTVSDLSIIWEGRTYTPAFYEGTALLSEGAEVALQAIANVTNSYGGLYAPHELSYSWVISNAGSSKLSGKAKHSVVVKNFRPREPLTVYVSVKDPTGVIRVEKSIRIPVHSTKTVLYENNPYVGIRYDKALGEVLGVYDREVSILAEPYYMSAKTRRDSTLEYEWLVAGERYQSPGGLVFGVEGDASGSTNVQVTIKNKKYWLQTARADLSISYGERNTWAIEEPANTTAL